MQHSGLYALSKKKFKIITTDSNHDLQVSLNLLASYFSATAMNQRWVEDISYVWTEEGWLYLAIVMDLYSKAVIGWAMASQMKQSLVCNALQMALWRRGFPK